MNIKMDFEQVWNLYYHTIKIYLSKRISNWQDADDLANDIFSVAYDHYGSFDPNKATIYTWLYNITMNSLKNYYRSKKSAVINSVTIPERTAAPDDIEQIALMEEKMLMLNEALESLPEKQKTAIRMQYFDELSSEEIAEKMNTTPGNVRVIINRAKKRLKELLVNLLDD